MNDALQHQIDRCGLCLHILEQDMDGWIAYGRRGSASIKMKGQSALEAVTKLADYLEQNQ